MKTTREGRRFILAALLIAVAALNTGNNLIFLVLALMLSMVLLSLLILKLNLSGLSVDALSLPSVFAGEAASFSVSLRNTKRGIPSYSVKILTKGMLSPVYYPIVPAGGEGVREARIVFERRGLYGHGDFIADSGFPFILFSGRKVMKVPREVLVYPALLDVGEMMSDIQGLESGEAARMSGVGDEIYSIREFRYGDDWRRIHWKASAKVSELMVREYSEQEVRKTTIILDNLDPSVPSSKSGKTDEVFEKAVSLAASISKFFIDSGHLVRVISCRKLIPFGGGDEQFFRILDILAVIGKETHWESAMPSAGDGYLVTVLRSPSAVMSGFASMSDMVIDAESL